MIKKVDESKTLDSSENQKDTSKSQATESSKLWDQIKNVKLDLYALPNQFVHLHCKPFLDLNKKDLYMTIKSSAVLPALEEALKQDFVVEQANKYIIVKRVDDAV